MKSSKSERLIQAPEIQTRENAPAAIDSALSEFEARFHIHFASYALYSKAFLAELHHAPAEADAKTKIEIATERDPMLLRHFAVFSEVANAERPSAELRSRYFEGLRAVYATLKQTPARFVSDGAVAFVAPEREGRILAQTMGWQPEEHSFHPNAKRIPYEGGLLVGLTEFKVERRFDRVEIIDGAIASGATLMAVMECMVASSQVFDIYSVHATTEGLRALAGFARIRNLDLSVFVGHVTAGLNKKYYATDSDNTRLVVGDLGDTISDLPEANRP